MLKEWKSQTTPKQRVTGTRLLRQLREEGYQCGATTVRTYLAEKRRQAAEVFIPLIHRPGDEAQVDFFEVTVEENGVRKKVWKFVMRLMYSGWDFIWLYDHCDQVSFLDGHVRAFKHFGGVPARCVYDNLKAAVKRIVLCQRELTNRFLALVSHYLFEPCFARVGEGHDKGGVESRGKNIRLQHFVPIPQGDSLAAISKQVLAALEREAQYKRDKTGCLLSEKIEEERRHLRRLPAYAFDPSQMIPVPINGSSLVTIDGVQYSVPSEWARLEAIAYVGVDAIRIACRNQTIVIPKLRAGKEQICYRHYLHEFPQKPQAVRQVAPELMAELGEPFQRLWKVLEETHGGREAGRVMAKILKAIHEHSLDVVRESVEESLAAQRTDFLWLAELQEETAPQRIPVPPALEEFVVDKASASDYNFLLRGCAHE